MGDGAVLPLAVSAPLFVVASAITWLAGRRLSNHAKQIADHTRASRAIVGALLLGGVASLPELVMSITAARFSDAELAVTTLIGGVPVALSMVALCDAAIGGRPVSSRVTNSTVLLRGIVLIMLLTMLAGTLVVRDLHVFHAGLGSLALALFPELSTIYGAVKLRQFEMAFGEAFGSNLLSIALIDPVDVVYPGSPLLNHVTTPALVAVLLGILSTAIYVGGLLGRSRITVMRLGLDSLLALLVYAAGVVLMSRLSD